MSKKIEVVKEISVPAIDFAAKELKKYLRKSGYKGNIRFILSCDAKNSEMDSFSIKGQDKHYIIKGSNPKSVLFGVYRFLHELGFRWLRPGNRGEIVPKISKIPQNISIRERASYKYRTLCIEGATSIQHAIDLIDWAAKNYMNGYFIQFDYGTHFFKRWYSHSDNPHLKPEKFDIEDARKAVDTIAKEVKKRGMRLEKMGHGWTCRALGIEGEGWDTTQDAMNLIPEEKKQWLAMIDGKRQFFKNVPLNTNLCYSNPAVRSAIADAIVDYAKQHPEVDAIHFWLADGSNNNCECENCQNERVSDFYVKILNELDEKLTAEGLKTKIVFLIYVDLLWQPEKEKIKNQDRFIIMFAPITRSYIQSFADTKPEEGIKPYLKNKLEFPKNAADNVLYLKKWQEIFNGEGVDFDYHLIWACYYDLSHFTLGSVLHKDIKYLKNMGLDGFISCQNQRTSFPTNFLMEILAKTLWNKNLSFNYIVNQSFSNAFGKKDAKYVIGFLKKISELWKPFFEPVFIPKPDEARIKKGTENIEKMKKACDRFKPFVEKRAKNNKGAIGWSWKYLYFYLQMLELMLPAYLLYLKRLPDCEQKFDKIFEFVRKNEKILHPALDVSTFIKVLQWRINEAKGLL
ncbi:MAG: DUF4838 domain-containing protein [Candidatus Omnitrophica bacterium]|nr:DUF4838 domain-containing protein [Candidatus Omnitrophota bacterium]